MADHSDRGWYAVRCLFRHESGPPAVYEERVTLWSAVSADEAIRLAEREALDYARTLASTYLGLAQAYTLSRPPGEGAEVFSLCRESDLLPTEYLNSYFDTGSERQRHWPES